MIDGRGIEVIMGSRRSGNHDHYGSASGSRPRRSRAGKDYDNSQIDYVAPSAEYSDGNGYSRRISSESYHSMHHKKARKRKILIAVVVVVAALLIGGGAAALGYMNFLNSQFHEGIDDMDALNDVLVTNNAPHDPFYVLLMGTDGRPEEDSDRSDTIILARIDPQAKRCVLVSIPRDTYTYVASVGEETKINAAYAYGGCAGAVQAVEDFSGVDISHYAEINFDRFKGLVDALGGVEVDVPMEIDDPDAGGYVPAGIQVLDGEHALIFCRTRATVIGDYQRQANQRIFLQAVASKVLASDAGTMLQAINAIAEAVSTDMNIEDIYSIANALKGLSATDIYTYTVPSDVGWAGEMSVIVPDMEAWQEMIATIDAGGLPEEQAWDIAGVIPDEYNAAAGAGGAPAATLDIDYTQYPITVRNGGGIEGSASAVADKLTAAGYPIGEMGNANQFVYDETLVIYNDPADQAVANNIVQIIGTGTTVESAGRYEFPDRIMVVVGSDYSE